MDGVELAQGQLGMALDLQEAGQRLANLFGWAKAEEGKVCRLRKERRVQRKAATLD